MNEEAKSTHLRPEDEEDEADEDDEDEEEVEDWDSVMSEGEVEDMCEFILESIEEYFSSNYALYYRTDFVAKLVEYVSENTVVFCDVDDKDEESFATVSSLVTDMTWEYLRNFLWSEGVVEPRNGRGCRAETSCSTAPGSPELELQLERLSAYATSGGGGALYVAQRTPEWFALRRSCITASNVSKLFSAKSRMRMVAEYAPPATAETTIMPPAELGAADSKWVTLMPPLPPQRASLTSSLHWGHKYEPAVKALYEFLFCTSVEEYGLIVHERVPYVGASPDGINNVREKNGAKFGRLVEIKSVVNREITGVPSNEYWIQVQTQMEVCGLDACDFVEAKLVEYQEKGFRSPESQFWGGSQSDPPEKAITYQLDAQNEAEIIADRPTCVKGVILQFFYTNEENGSSPTYEYMPIELYFAGKSAVDAWTTQTKEAYCSSSSSSPNAFYLYDTIYWSVDVFSCICIRRNREWFATILPTITDAWNDIAAARLREQQRQSYPPPETSSSLPSSSSRSIVVSGASGHF